MAELKDKVVVVTGAAQGMGAATARLAAEAGAKVVLADVADATPVVEEIKSAGGDAAYVTANISDPAAVEAMVQFAVDTYGRLDGAVNNAAKAPDTKPLVDMDIAEFDAVMNVDLRGTALCLKAEIAQMRKQGGGGAIVNISSAIALKPGPACPAYIAAKHGVIGLTKSAALDYGTDGIRTNCVAPGSVDTVMLHAYLQNLGIDPAEYAANTTTVGRFARPEEVARGSLWLLSDASSYVNGVVLGVEGGYQDR